MATTTTGPTIYTFILLTLLSLHSSLSCPPHHKRSLLQFKSLLSSSDTTISALESWHPTTNCCHWDSVTCDPHPPHAVTELLLSAQLPLPRSLFESRNLSAVDFSRNNLSGELPENIGHAVNVILLLLSKNRFFGPVPVSISNMSRLRMLDISSNQFTGDVPVSFGPQVKVLDLSRNNFSGNLPENLTSIGFIEHLDLHSNNITGEIPESLTRIPSLQVLNVRDNDLQGEISQGLSNLSRLHVLDLSGNRLTGSIPPELGTLRGMIHTTSTYSYVRIIVNCKGSLRTLAPGRLGIYSLLDLSRNELSGEIPPSLGDLRGLKVLNISNNKLSGKIPASLGKLKKLESLDLSRNWLSGEIPQTFVQLNELTKLDVSHNKLFGNIPTCGQMATMADPGSYADNSGLCGFQVEVPCGPSQPPPEFPTG